MYSVKISAKKFTAQHILKKRWLVRLNKITFLSINSWLCTKNNNHSDFQLLHKLRQSRLKQRLQCSKDKGTGSLLQYYEVLVFIFPTTQDACNPSTLKYTTCECMRGKIHTWGPSPVTQELDWSWHSGICKRKDGRGLSTAPPSGEPYMADLAGHRNRLPCFQGGGDKKVFRSTWKC